MFLSICVFIVRANTGLERDKVEQLEYRMGTQDTLDEIRDLTVILEGLDKGASSLRASQAGRPI